MTRCEHIPLDFLLKVNIRRNTIKSREFELHLYNAVASKDRSPHIEQEKIDSKLLAPKSGNCCLRNKIRARGCHCYKQNVPGGNVQGRTSGEIFRCKYCTGLLS